MESVDTPSDLYVIAMAHRFIPISAPFAMDAAMTSNLQTKTPHKCRRNSQTQNPGGLIRWLTLVHFGTSVYIPTRQHSIRFPSSPFPSILPPPHTSNQESTLTMNPLPIPLLLPIKNGIFILRPHLLLPRHLRLPPLDLLQRAPLFP